MPLRIQLRPDHQVKAFEQTIFKGQGLREMFQMRNRALELSNGGIECHENCSLNAFHILSQCLRQFNNFGLSSVENSRNVKLKSGPKIKFSDMEKFEDFLDFSEASCQSFRLVTECFDKTAPIFLTIDSDYKAFDGNF